MVRTRMRDRDDSCSYVISMKKTEQQNFLQFRSIRLSCQEMLQYELSNYLNGFDNVLR